MWTETTLKFLAGIAGDINLTHLIERLHSQTALLTKWTLKFLPDLPTVEAEVEGVLESAPQRPLRDRDDQAQLCFENGVVVLTKDRVPTLVPYSLLPPFLFVWDKQVRPAAFNEESLDEGPHGHWTTQSSRSGCRETREPSTQEEERREQTRPQAQPTYRVGTGA